MSLLICESHLESKAAEVDGTNAAVSVIKSTNYMTSSIGMKDV